MPGPGDFDRLLRVSHAAGVRFVRDAGIRGQHRRHDLAGARRFGASGAFRRTVDTDPIAAVAEVPFLVRTPDKKRQFRARESFVELRPDSVSLYSSMVYVLQSSMD